MPKVGTVAKSAVQSERGTCPICHEEFAVTSKGVLRRHPAGGRMTENAYWCRGSGDYPVLGPHVHQCACGARWDENVTTP